mmetsp:Transcript_19547/g.45407  ORF Transcript_19547/g.45407 Transcript_19547/m.45407 type:complete len:228 (-) Transcript_19547:1538-2221(-)
MQQRRANLRAELAGQDHQGPLSTFSGGPRWSQRIMHPGRGRRRWRQQQQKHRQQRQHQRGSVRCGNKRAKAANLRHGQPRRPQKELVAPYGAPHPGDSHRRHHLDRSRIIILEAPPPPIRGIAQGLRRTRRPIVPRFGHQPPRRPGSGQLAALFPAQRERNPASIQAEWDHPIVAVDAAASVGSLAEPQLDKGSHAIFPGKRGHFGTWTNPAAIVEMRRPVFRIFGL